MKKINVAIDINYEVSHLHITESLKFHFIDKNNCHIHGYWLFRIGRDGATFDREVGTSVGPTNIDTNSDYNDGRLKIIGVDEL